MDRLTGGACSGTSTQKGRSAAAALSSNSGGGVKNSGAAHTLRNESYYMATNETWSPAVHHPKHVNNSVLIEHDPEPTSP